MAAPAQSTAYMVPKYEVKLLLDPSIVLDVNTRLDPTVLETFGVSIPGIKMNVQFLDTNNKDIYEKGWSLRIRKVQGKDDCELTYKRRYKIINGDIDATLATAHKDGFDSATTTYEAEVDWGYVNQTLSINRDKSYPDRENDAAKLPGEAASREMLIEKAPDKFINSVESDWGIDKLRDSRIYGPVLVDRYTGAWSSEKVNIEVWPIKNAAGTGTEYIVEASLKVKKRTTASEKHYELMTLLEMKGWLLARDSLRTSLIMERY